ncbi:hypothetical protein U6B65_00360 [Oscillospiraceae bacterium MB08-C2-2]|nr:hypothetical protein U6B65_00360 [Oscillospiraceae bacterium MB08-C2-2]
MTETTLVLPFGVLNGVATVSHYPNGTPQDVTLREKNVILTHVGELIPLYKTDSARRKYKSAISFHPSGTIKSVSLQQQQDIQTPIGEFPAELVTFYETGELKRFFVLDGQLSGFWSIEDERALNIAFSFEFPFAAFQAMLVGICLYKSGSIRSLTLFPGEQISLTLDGLGTISVRTGFSLYEDGQVRSLEPAVPSAVKTPIGTLWAYDAQALGISADSSSLMLDQEGRIIALSTMTNRIVATVPGYPVTTFTQQSVTDPINPLVQMKMPLRIVFDYQKNLVIIGDSEPLPMSKEWFIVFQEEGAPTCSPDACASCRLCQDKTK